jgi:hypothetical protein
VSARGKGHYRRVDSTMNRCAAAADRSSTIAVWIACWRARILHVTTPTRLSGRSSRKRRNFPSNRFIRGVNLGILSWLFWHVLSVGLALFIGKRNERSSHDREPPKWFVKRDFSRRSAPFRTNIASRADLSQIEFSELFIRCRAPICRSLRIVIDSKRGWFVGHTESYCPQLL